MVEVKLTTVPAGEETIEPLILTIVGDGFRCEAGLTVLSIRRVGLSPVQVPPAMPAGEMLLLVDLIELARAIDRH